MLTYAKCSEFKCIFACNVDAFSISLFSSLLLILSFHLYRTDVGFVHVVYMSREFSIEHRIANRSSFLVAVLRGTIMSPNPVSLFAT